MEKLTKRLATKLAKHDFNDLANILSDMSLIEAYNMLNGFNLEMGKSTCGDELMGLTISFDFNYKHINGTIFRIADGSYEGACELYNRISVWDDEFSSPIIDCLEMEVNLKLADMNENNQLVLETLESLKNNEVFVTMLDFGVIELRLETYRDLDAPNDYGEQKTYDNLDDAIKFCNDKELYVACFVDGINWECVNILDL